MRLQIRRRDGVRNSSTTPEAIYPPSVAAEQQWPRLRVWKTPPTRLGDYLGRYRWAWRITAPDGRALDAGLMQTWGGALTIGLTALEQQSTAAAGASSEGGRIGA